MAIKGESLEIRIQSALSDNVRFAVLGVTGDYVAETTEIALGTHEGGYRHLLLHGEGEARDRRVIFEKITRSRKEAEVALALMEPLVAQRSLGLAKIFHVVKDAGLPNTFHIFMEWIEGVNSVPVLDRATAVAVAEAAAGFGRELQGLDRVLQRFPKRNTYQRCASALQSAGGGFLNLPNGEEKTPYTKIVQRVKRAMGRRQSIPL